MLNMSPYYEEAFVETTGYKKLTERLLNQWRILNRNQSLLNHEGFWGFFVTTCTFLGPFKLWNCPSIQLLHGLGSGWRYWGWGHPCPWRTGGEKVNPELQMCSTWIEDYIWVISLGLVLYRDGVRKVQDGDGGFHGAWSASSEPGETSRSCQRIWSFFIVGSRGFQDGTGSQYSLPGTWCIFCLLFSYHIKLYIQQSVVETTTRSCSLSLVLNSVSQCVWFLCLLFPKHSGFPV